MKSKFAVLAVLGALIALAIPATSTATMFPAGHKFEIAGNIHGPKIATALGSCLLAKVTSGQIPSAPQNESPTPFAVTAPTVGSCTAGTSVAVAGEWTFSADNYYATLASSSPTAITMRFSSLPGCKLSGPANLMAIWSNGSTAPTFLWSGYHAHRGFALTWSNDGATCALAGSKEAVKFESEQVVESTSLGVLAPVRDLTNPSTAIIVGRK
jgi:hypothetical protein